MTTNLTPVDLAYLSDRARAYVMGLEAKVRELRETNQQILDAQRTAPPASVAACRAASRKDS